MKESNMKAQYPTNKQLEPAFPHREYDSRPYYHGMSLRDYFATFAPPMPGWWPGKGPADSHMDKLISWRWYYADAMLQERGEG